MTPPRRNSNPLKIKKTRDWGLLEKTWQNALKQNKEVKVSIQPVYSGKNKRPTSFVVEQQINGVTLPARRLQNTASGK